MTDPETMVPLNMYTNMPTTPENFVKIGLVVSEISLLQAIVKKERKNGKESNSGIISVPAEAWWTNDARLS